MLRLRLMNKRWWAPGRQRKSKSLIPPQLIPTDPKQLNILRQTFENIAFVLKADKSCNIKMPVTGARVPKGYWTYDSAQAKIGIVNWQNRNTASAPKMFEMFLKDKDGQSLWVMYEKNFLFEMQMEKKK